ncbi:MAG TPA: CRISPR-associated endonuclease Cas1, partial [Thermoflexia bacterium]|nr:CRISPR-associated endonuclease Cas1 [Thermoflexia bacterium]
MPTLYLREQGAVLRKVGERLVVTKGEEVLEDVPIIHVDQVVVMGNVQLTTPAVALLLRKEVDVVFLSSRGRFRGRLVTTGSKFARLRHAQLRMLDEEKAVLAVARELVAAKLINQAHLLERLGARRAAREIERDVRKARRASSLDGLRGHEGAAGARYFAALRRLIPSEWGFVKRTYHPPPDPVNALLSLGYTLLLKDAVAAAQLVGLDPYLGFFHALDYGRPSLALDLIEPFRPLVDGLVLGWIVERKVSPRDFRPARREDGAVLLDDEARTRYFRAYERQME